MERENEKRRYDRTYAQIDLGAVRHNITLERKRVGTGVKIMAVIKANAYTMGILKWQRHWLTWWMPMELPFRKKL